MNTARRLRKYLPDTAILIVSNLIYHVYIRMEAFLAKKFVDKYDFQTRQILKRVLTRNSNWVDVGAHKGYILKQFLAASDKGIGYAFEPIPTLFEKLRSRYGKKVMLYQLALSDSQGERKFVYFKDRPAVSGFNKRQDFNENYSTEDIVVKVDTIDNIVDSNIPIHAIKIDVEGAEMEVLRGAQQTILRSKPVILFEFGKEGAELYHANAGIAFDFFSVMGLRVSTLEYFINNKPSLSREEFECQYEKGYNYFFIAYNPQASYAPPEIQKKPEAWVAAKENMIPSIRPAAPEKQASETELTSH